jgi:CRP-like cAMP-binding protein
MNNKMLIEFFQGTNLMSLQKAEEIAGHFIYKSIPKQSFFVREGKIAEEYFFLEQGFMRAFAHDTEGNEVKTNFYSSGQVVFEVSSFFNRTICRENFQALTDCEGWVLTHQQLNNLFHSLIEFREFGRHILVKGFRVKDPHAFDDH